MTFAGLWHLRLTCYDIWGNYDICGWTCYDICGNFDISGRFWHLRALQGGTSILKVSGTCRWTGYDFAIIAIKTGCLNQPNYWHRVSKSAYLATGTDYSVYHRVAFPPTMFMTGPRSRHRRDASVRAGPAFQRSLLFFLWTGVNYMKIIFIEFVLL